MVVKVEGELVTSWVADGARFFLIKKPIEQDDDDDSQGPRMRRRAAKGEQRNGCESSGSQKGSRQREVIRSAGRRVADDVADVASSSVADADVVVMLGYVVLL